MKYYLFCFAALAICSCKTKSATYIELVNAVKQKLHAVNVTVKDTVEKGANDTAANRMEIFVDMGNSAGGGRVDVLTDAYQTAAIAFKTVTDQHAKMPAIFRIRVKVNQVTADHFDYRSAFMGKSTAIEQKIKSFMEAVVQKRYQDLAKYMEPGLNLLPIIDIFKNADAAGDAVNGYQFISLQHGTGIHNPDKKPMAVIQGWVLITGKASNREYPMLFIANPSTSQLSSVYINPGKQQ